jgi:hypothetical protein
MWFKKRKAILAVVCKSISPPVRFHFKIKQGFAEQIY